MRCFHRTTSEAASAIAASGFHDTEGSYLTLNLYSGVWVSDVPLDDNEGAVGVVLFAIDLPVSVFEEYEWVEEHKTYREALIPAAILNAAERVVVDD